AEAGAVVSGGDDGAGGGVPGHQERGVLPQVRRAPCPRPGISFRAGILRPRAVVFLAVLHHDRSARAAHDHRHRHHAGDVLVDVARNHHRGLLQPHRNQRVVLALRRHRLDFPVSVALPHRTAWTVTDHILPKRVYYTIFGILMLGTYLTVQIAFFDLGRLNTVVALTIAVIKATLVVLFFMHVKYSTRLTWVVVLGSIFWLGIMFVLTMGDYLTRVWRTYG